MTNQREIAEDIAREVFMFFIKYPEKFDARRVTLVSFLCGAARNEIFNHLKKSGVRFETNNFEFEDFENLSDGGGKSLLKILLDKKFFASNTTAKNMKWSINRRS